MKIWIILQSVIDVVIFFVIVFFLFKNGQKSKPVEIVKESPDISPLVESLNQLLEESTVIARILADENKVANKLKEEIDERLEEFGCLMKEAEQVALSSKTPNEEKSGGDSLDHRYAQVSKLLKSGIASEDVSRKTGVSSREVDLIAKLSQAR